FDSCSTRGGELTADLRLIFCSGRACSVRAVSIRVERLVDRRTRLSQAGGSPPPTIRTTESSISKRLTRWLIRARRTCISPCRSAAWPGSARSSRTSVASRKILGLSAADSSASSGAIAAPMRARPLRSSSRVIQKSSVIAVLGKGLTCLNPTHPEDEDAAGSAAGDVRVSPGTLEGEPPGVRRDQLMDRVWPPGIRLVRPHRGRTLKQRRRDLPQTFDPFRGVE